MRIHAVDAQSSFGTMSLPTHLSNTTMAEMPKVSFSSPVFATPAVPMTSTLLSTSSRVFSILTSSSPVEQNTNSSLLFASSSESLIVDVDDGGGVNTPLNAPEPSLDPVTDIPWLGDPSALSDLAWIVPTTIVCIAIMIGLAFAFFFAIRKCELRMLGWCYRNCACCCSLEDGEGGRLIRGEREFGILSDSIVQTGQKESVRLKEFRKASPQLYGGGAKVQPRRDYNPFDHDDDDDS